MAFNRNKDKGDIAIVAFFIAIAALALVFVIPFARTQPNVNPTKLGTWYNMPNASQCPVDVNGGDQVPDSCELMGNTSYRGVYLVGTNSAQSSVAFSVSCVSPSNNNKALLVLQVANYDPITQMNVTNFVNVGPIGLPSAFVNLTATNPFGVNCPGMLWSSSFTQSLIGGVDFVYRIVGESGGGTGDNPRLTNIMVDVSGQFTKAGGTAVSSITTSGFNLVLTVSYPTSSSISGSAQWIATNSTNTVQFSEHGVKGCTINVGTSSCNTAVTFSPVFKTLPNVVATSNINPFQVFVGMGSITLFSVEVVNV